MGLILNWLREYSGAILALMAIIGSVFGSTLYIVDEIRDVEDELRAEIRAGDAELREDLRAVDAQLRQDIRHLDAKMTAGDAQLREEIRSLDAKMAASDVQLREEIRAGDVELRLSLENLSNRILEILSGEVNKPVRQTTTPPVFGAGG